MAALETEAAASTDEQFEADSAVLAPSEAAMMEEGIESAAATDEPSAAELQDATDTDANAGPNAGAEAPAPAPIAASMPSPPPPRKNKRASGIPVRTVPLPAAAQPPAAAAAAATAATAASSASAAAAPLRSARSGAPARASVASRAAPVQAVPAASRSSNSTGSAANRATAAATPAAARPGRTVTASAATDKPAAVASVRPSGQSSSSKAGGDAAAPSAASGAQSAAARHAAYLASIVAARDAARKEERRRKPDVKTRLTATFSLSQQAHMTAAPGSIGSKVKAGNISGGAASVTGPPPVDRVSQARDAELSLQLPRVFSMLGGWSVDVLRGALKDRGWIENKNEWSTVWGLQWSIVGRVIDYARLQPLQVVNHFERMHCITSKSGLCASIATLARYADADSASFFPRCFALHQFERDDLAEFRRAFRANIVANYVLRFVRTFERENGVRAWELEGNTTSAVEADGEGEGTSSEDEEDEEEAEAEEQISERPTVASFDPQLLQLCFIALQAHLRLLGFERDGLDNSLEPPPEPSFDASTAQSSSSSPALAALADARGLALKEYANLLPSEWIMLEREVQRIEDKERGEDLARQKKREEALKQQKQKQGATTEETKEEATVAFGALGAGDAAATTAAEEEEEQEDGRNDSDPSFSPSPSASPVPAAAAAAAAEDDAFAAASDHSAPAPVEEQESEDEPPSLARLSLLSRVPLPVGELYAHFVFLLRILRERDPQHFSLSHPSPPPPPPPPVSHGSSSSNNNRYPRRSERGVRNLWILKPGGLSRGRGIEVHHSFDAIMSLLRKGGRFVAQKYIERPLLVFRKKFDLRHWVE